MLGGQALQLEQARGLSAAAREGYGPSAAATEGKGGGG